MFVFTSWLVSHEVCIHIKYFGYLHFPAPALCLAPGPGPQFVFTGFGLQFVSTGPAPNLYLPALAPNLYLPVLVPNLYLPTLARNFYLPTLVLHIPTLSPQFAFTDPGLRFLLLCNDFAFTFLSIVVAVTVVILAIVVTS